MKPLLFGAAAMLLAMASCSNDEVVMEKTDSNAIKFAVTTARPSRAADVYCQTNMFDQFNVFAVTDGKMYIDNDLIKKDGTKWVNQGGTRYWPTTPVDFYGIVNDGGTFSLYDSSNAIAPRFNAFAPASTVADQTDLLYSVKTGQDRNTNAGQVDMNFKHALSQIVFRAKNTNKNLYVEIYGVKVCKVGAKGDYVLPTTDTDPNVPCDVAMSEDGKVTVDASKTLPYGTSNWTLATDTASYYAAVNLNADGKAVVALPYGTYETSAVLTDVDTHTTNPNQAMLLIPQVTKKIEFTDPTSWLNNEGTYFRVSCRVWNVADGTTYNPDTDVLLWGTEDAPADIMIPVAFNWVEGYKYTYTFVFGEGNGGFNPDPKPDPDPVLVPITFDVTVDHFIDFQDGDGNEINTDMGKVDTDTNK